MSKAEDLLASGNLRSAIQELTAAVKSDPADSKLRTFLFELFCFAGEWDRAERQLGILSEESPKAAVGAQIYRNNIQAERDRSCLFSDGLRPQFLFDTPSYIALHLEAVNRMREGRPVEARELLDRAEEQRPALQGKVNGKDFLDFRDYDDVAGPVLELIVGGQYVWLPFEQIKSLEIPRPGRLRDLIWPEVRIDTIEGSIGEVFAFALYEGSSSHEDDRVKLGRMTDWVKLGEDLYRGSGLRLLLIDEYDSPIFEANRVEFCNDNFTTGPLPM